MQEPKSTMHRPWSSYDFDSSTKLIALQMPHALKMAEWPIRDFDSTHSAMAVTIQGTSLVATLSKLPAHWWMSLVDTLNDRFEITACVDLHPKATSVQKRGLPLNSVHRMDYLSERISEHHDPHDVASSTSAEIAGTKTYHYTRSSA